MTFSLWLTSILTFLILSANCSEEIVSLALTKLGLKLIIIIIAELPTIESLRILVILEFRYGIWELPSPIDLIQWPSAVKLLLILINSFNLNLLCGLLSRNDLSNFSLPAKSTNLSLVMVIAGPSANLGRCMSMMLKIQWLLELCSFESVRPVCRWNKPCFNSACADD